MDPFQRVVVVGSTGAGKTTLARTLAERLDVRHVELDALHWDPGWVGAEREVFRSRVAEALTGERWVADGNYSAVRDIVWGRASILVWLDYPLPLILYRLARRTMQRVATGTELWNGNRERLREVFSRESIFVWAVQTYGRRRRLFSTLLTEPTYAHLTVFHLRSPRATETWLRERTCSSPPFSL